MPTVIVDPSQFVPAEVNDLGDIQFSNPSRLDLGVYRGDTGTFRVTVTASDGVTPVNVSSATWDCDIRSTAETATAIGSMAVTPVVGQTNQVDVALPKIVSALLAVQADPYVWDLEMTLGAQVQTILRGTIAVTPDVSRAT